MRYIADTTIRYIDHNERAMFGVLVTGADGVMPCTYLSTSGIITSTHPPPHIPIIIFFQKSSGTKHTKSEKKMTQ